MAYKGWHSRGYLPHFDSAETIQSVTFRLADGLPRQVVEQLLALPDSLAETDQRLDNGWGDCWLKDPNVAAMVQEALLHCDGDRYKLLAWCLMPNHVHVVIMPEAQHGLGAIVQAWKSFSAKQATGCSDGRVRSGARTTLTDSSATKVIFSGPSNMLRTIR